MEALDESLCHGFGIDRCAGTGGTAGGGTAEATQHRRHHGRRHRHVEHRCLSPRHDGGPDAEPRQARQRGHVVHRLLRRGKLHGRSRELHHGRAADPHRHDHGRPSRCQDRHTGGSGDHRHGAQVHGLRHRPVRQKSPRRSQRVPAHRSRLRRILRLFVSPRCDGRSGTSQLSAEPVECRRPAQHGA